MKLLGVIGTPSCGCQRDAWVVVASRAPHLECFRHELPQAVAVVVDKPWVTPADLARQMVAKFLRLDVDDVEPDHPLGRGTLAAVHEQLRLVAPVPSGATVTVNGRFLLYRHADGAGSRPLGRLAAAP